jgi:hypothetical protein
MRISVALICAVSGAIGLAAFTSAKSPEPVSAPAVQKTFSVKQPDYEGDLECGRYFSAAAIFDFTAPEPGAPLPTGEANPVDAAWDRIHHMSGRTQANGAQLEVRGVHLNKDGEVIGVQVVAFKNGRPVGKFPAEPRGADGTWFVDGYEHCTTQLMPKKALD